MFGLESSDLPRMQFAFTASFHSLSLAITIGLATFMAVMLFGWNGVALHRHGHGRRRRSFRKSV